MKRRLFVALLTLFLVGTGYVAWTLAGLPPVRFLLRYGLSPGCEPTGNVMILEGVEFVEIGPGIFRMGSEHLAEGGDWLGRVCEPFGLPWGTRPKASNHRLRILKVRDCWNLTWMAKGPAGAFFFGSVTRNQERRVHLPLIVL